MKVLLVGGAKVDKAAEVLKQRFNIDVQMCSGPDGITVLGSAGVRVDRVLIFEQAITCEGKYIDKANIRKSTQAIVDALKDAFENFDVIGVADNNVVRQSMVEELFEIKHRSCVIYARGNVLSANMLAALVGKTVTELNELYKGNEVDRSIYRSIDTVKWSSEIEQMEDWDDTAVVSTRKLLNKNENVRLNTLTGEWEEIDPETGLTASEAAKKLKEEEAAARMEAAKHKKRLFGNRKF